MGPFWSSSILVVFHFGRLPFWSSSIFVVFHFGHLPFCSSSILVVFHLGHLPFWSSSILVVFYFGRLPLLQPSFFLKPSSEQKPSTSLRWEKASEVKKKYPSISLLLVSSPLAGPSLFQIIGASQSSHLVSH